ncbi:MAG TPA: serine/threonine-protein kinase [Enhygromyxa sp.]|nr:serine/threonine-protein kinase [Enhygromyxa sp.]
MDSEELRWTEPNDAPEEGTLVAGLIDPSDHVADFDTGAKLGRYVVLSHMGTGGMGVVYAAYDPELDRRIALKLMHPSRTRDGGGDPEASARASRRMLAEAKAMAQLSHPNVITVHDVGTIEDRVFIAMEFVEGVPLSEWMRTPGRAADWREVLDVFIRAGRGLEAAHAVGLVHRDFKPDNVLVGADGRVRVLDFGLARRFDGTREPLDRRDREAGTPAYMSPEQHLGKPLDHRADQFSFCVALYEALYGELPFAAKTRLELALAVTDGRVGPAPKGASVPNWVRWALLRGLDPDPQGRWPNIAALLEALSRDPYHKLRRWAVGTGAAVVSAAVLTLLVQIGLANGGDGEPSSDRAQCTNAEQRVGEVWNNERRASVRETFARLDEPLAPELAGELERGIDRWSGDWANMHRETCEASVLGEQSDTMLDRRMMCLDRRLAELDELIEVVSDNEAQSFVRAGEVLRKLPELGTCEAAAIEAGRDSGESVSDDGELQALVVETIDRDLFRAAGLEMTGSFAEAEALAEGGLVKARALGDRRLIASALLTQAKLARAQGQLGAVAMRLEEALLEAERAGADHLRGEILIALARSEAELGEGAAAARRAREARAVLDRVGASELEYAELDGVTALASIASGELERAEREARAAIGAIASLEPAPIELAELRTTMGVALRELDRFAEARTELAAASALWAEHYGEQHPIIASVRFERALVDAREGQHDVALLGFAEVLVVFERVFGGNSLEVARVSQAMAVTLGKLGRYEESLRRYQQARAIFRANLSGDAGPAALALARTLDHEGQIRRELGQLDEALSLHQQALALLGRGTSVRADVLINLGEVLLDLQRDGEAREALAEALELLVRSERAQDQPKLARARFAAARAWSIAGENERARSLALEARAGVVELGDGDSTKKIDAWLATLDA